MYLMSPHATNLNPLADIMNYFLRKSASEQEDEKESKYFNFIWAYTQILACQDVEYSIHRSTNAKMFTSRFVRSSILFPNLIISLP